MKSNSVLFFLSICLFQCIHFYHCIPSFSLHLQNRCPVLRLPNGRVERARGKFIRFICNDGYTLVGSKYSMCIRGEWDTPVPVCVNAECGHVATPEHALVASKYNGAVLIYFCEAGYTLIGVAEIYCDGRQWNSTAPFCIDSKEEAPTKCDFERADLCWWTQDPRHDFDWRRHNFETPSSHIGTGPTHDHTLGAGNAGHYLYIEASGRLENDTARIVSPLYNNTLADSGCFSFWYHMYGGTIGALNVYFKLENGEPQLMFSKRGNQGNQWLHGIFNLPKADSDFQIIIEGVRGASYVSDIAVDDVALLQGRECDINSRETISATTSNDDQVELVSASQTCKGRCNSFPTSHYVTIASQDISQQVFPAEECQCTIDCAEYSLCCPDYGEYCLPSFTYSTDGVIADITQLLTTSTTHTVATDTTTTAMPRTTMKIPIITTHRNHFPINPKDDIDPYATKPKETPTSTPKTTVAIKPSTKVAVTNASTIASTTTTTTTTTTAATTTKRTTLPVTMTQKSTTTKSPKVTIPNHTELITQHEVQERIVNPQKVPKNRKIGLAGIIGLIIGILAGIAVISLVAFVLITRRKTYKRGTTGSTLSEDSDVRFLTSDEILDFNLAKPNDNDDL